MRKHNPRVKVTDMLQGVDRIMSYTSGMTFEDFIADRKTQDAVIWNIPMLGEATTVVHEQIEWSEVIRSRQILAREYDKIDYSIIWRIVTVHCPDLKISLENLLRSV